MNAPEEITNEEITKSFRAGAFWVLYRYAAWGDSLIALCLDDITQTAWCRYLSGQDRTDDLFRIGKHAAQEYVRKNGSFYRNVAFLSDEVEGTKSETSSDFTFPSDTLEEAFLQQRNKKGDRGRKAAARDVKILEMIIQGYSNDGIALEIGSTPTSVATYRKQIRRRLADFAKTLDISSTVAQPVRGEETQGGQDHTDPGLFVF